MFCSPSFARRSTAVVLALAVGFSLSACASDPGTPVDASGNPLAQNDPERFMPARLSGTPLKPLAPHEQARIQERIKEFGLDGWLAGAIAGVRSMEADPAPVHAVVGQTTTVDADLLPRLAFLISGPGEVGDITHEDIDGKDVVKGRVVNTDGRFEFVAWQARPDVAVALVSTKQSAATGYDADESMRQVIEWSES